jgi:hypothetical protein
MPGTYEPIATTTLGSDTASIEFTSISGSFTDLVLVFSGFTNATAAGVVDVRVGNGTIDTGANYSGTRIIGYSGGTLSDRYTGENQWQWSASSTDRSTFIVNFMNYSNTTTYKTVIDRQNAAANGVETDVWLWRSTSAINRIILTANNSGLLKSTTSVTLYGIKSA